MRQHHGIDYCEFGVTDMAATQAFFRAAFGWSFQAYGPDYAGIQIDGAEVGGLVMQDEVARGGALVVLYSDDLESSLAAVERAGGTIVKAPFEFPGGRRFHFCDPSGNELAVWSASK